jgi:3',5'-cyclic AMP phosphodiesterase CpdA
MKIIILHLSDIHISGISDPILEQAEKIASCTYSDLPEALQLFCVVSGDIAYSGKKNNMPAHYLFLNHLNKQYKKRELSL